MQTTHQLIGILGGTFDPVHKGHIFLATEIYKQFPFATIKLLPAFQPVHRALPSASVIDRLAMLKLAIAGHPGLSIDDREITRGGPSYMIDTLISLREEFGAAAPLCLIMATDAFADFDHWHRWQEIPNYAHIFLVQRPGYDLPLNNEKLHAFIAKHKITNAALLQQQPAGYLFFSSIMGLPVSSTQIRNLIATHEDGKTLVQDAVWHYIERHRLYKQIA